jgi:hypothetical protein
METQIDPDLLEEFKTACDCRGIDAEDFLTSILEEGVIAWLESDVRE